MEKRPMIYAATAGMIPDKRKIKGNGSFDSVAKIADTYAPIP
jgi:hypothetical protein